MQHVQVDKATSFQANQFSSQIKKQLLPLITEQNKSDNSRDRNKASLFANKYMKDHIFELPRNVNIFLHHLVATCVNELHHLCMYNRHTEKITAGLKRVRKVVDDILIYTPSLPILKKRAFAFFVVNMVSLSSKQSRGCCY